MAIQSFANPAIERFFREGRLSKGVAWGRVVFRWTDPGPAEVDIRDHH